MNPLDLLLKVKHMGKYSDEDIESAHEKQRHVARGQGGVIFTPVEKEIIENHVQRPKKED